MLGCQTKTTSPPRFYQFIDIHTLKEFFLRSLVILGPIHNPT